MLLLFQSSGIACTITFHYSFPWISSMSWPFQGGASFVDHFCYFCYLCFLFVMLSCLFIAALCSSAGKGLTSWLFCMLCFIVFLSLSHVVSGVRCGTWLYLFLIFASLLTLKCCHKNNPKGFDKTLLDRQPGLNSATSAQTLGSSLILVYTVGLLPFIHSLHTKWFFSMQLIHKYLDIELAHHIGPKIWANIFGGMISTPPYHAVKYICSNFRTNVLSIS